MQKTSESALDRGARRETRKQNEEVDEELEGRPSRDYRQINLGRKVHARQEQTKEVVLVVVMIITVMTPCIIDAKVMSKMNCCLNANDRRKVNTLSY